MDNIDTQTISEQQDQQDQQAPAWADVDVVTVPEATAEPPAAKEGKSTAPGAPVVQVVEDEVTDIRGWANLQRGKLAGDRLLGSTDFESIRKWGGWSSRSWSPEIAEKILLEVADGKSIRSICKRKGMPHRVSVYLWARDCPAFSHALRVAQEMGGDSIVDDMADLEVDVLSGTIHNRAARVVLESRRWRASKMNSRYGDNKRVEIDLESRSMRVTLDGSVRMQQDGQLQSLARDMADRAARLLPDPNGK